MNPIAPVAQLDRALPSEGKGHTFESCRVRHLVLIGDPPKLGACRAKIGRSSTSLPPDADLIVIELDDDVEIALLARLHELDDRVGRLLRLVLDVGDDAFADVLRKHADSVPPRPSAGKAPSDANVTGALSGD